LAELGVGGDVAGSALQSMHARAATLADFLVWRTGRRRER
jgi:hypothetical protein